MKKIFSFVFGLVLMLMLVSPVAAQGGPRMVSQAGSPEAMKMQKVPGPHFRAAESVVISEDLVGDVFVAGGNVQIDGQIDGDLLVAGGTVTINGEVTDDVRAGGGTVIVNGLIGDNLTVGGGAVMLGSNSEIGGSLVGGAGTFDFQGKVAGNSWLGAGETKLGGVFGQDVNLETGNLYVPQTAEIGGGLKARVEEKSEVSDQAVIRGEKEIKMVERMKDYKHEEFEANKMDAFKSFLAAKFVTKTLMGLALGLALMYLFPTIAKNLSKVAAKAPLANLGWGFVFLIMAPIVAILAMVTVIGLPLGMLVMALYMVSMMLAVLVAGKALGAKLAERFQKAKWLKNGYWQFVAGYVLLQVVGVVPLLGWLAKFGAFLIGLGAIWVVFKSNLAKKGK